MIDAFTHWLSQVQPEIEGTGLLLATSLDSEPEGLINDLVVIEALNARVGELRGIADKYLTNARLQFLPDKKEGLSETERKMTLEDKSADVKRVRDILETYQEAIKQRLILGESILAYHRSFPDPNAGLKPMRSAADIMRRQ